MLYALPDSLGAIKSAMLGMALGVKAFSMIGSSVVNMVEASEDIKDSWKAIAEAIKESRFDKAADQLSVLAESFGTISAEMYQIHKVFKYLGAKNIADIFGGGTKLFYILEGIALFAQAITALGNIMKDVAAVMAVVISRNEKAVQRWNDLAKALEKFPIVGKWVARFVERINNSLAAGGNLPWENLAEKYESAKEFIESLEEALRTFDHTGIIKDLRENVAHYKKIYDDYHREFGDTLNEAVDKQSEHAQDYLQSLLALSDAMKDLRDAWEDFIKTVDKTSRDLRREYMLPEERLMDSYQNWYKAQFEFNMAIDEEKLEKAQELYDATMELYDAEKAILLEKHEKEMEAAQEMIDVIEELRDRQKNFLEAIDEQISGMYTEIGTPGDKFSAQRRMIENIKDQISNTSGEERLTLIEQLKDAYSNYLSMGASLFGTESGSYQRIWNDVKAGLENIRDQYQIETEAMISVQEQQLEVLTGTSDTTKAIAVLAERQRGELSDLNTKYQTFLDTLSGVGGVQVTVLNEEIEGIRGEIALLEESFKGWIEEMRKEFFGGGDGTSGRMFKSISAGVYDASPIPIRLPTWAEWTQGKSEWGKKGKAFGMDYVPYDQTVRVHQGERITRKGFPAGDSGTEHFVFVPYGMSEAEQERLFETVIKPQLASKSKHSQFIYDRAIIKTNRGI